MATSGSTDWNKTRDEICKRALRLIGKLDPNVTPPAHDINTTAEALNGLLKSWNNTIIGFQLFTQKHATLFLNRTKTDYVLGPTGDYCTASYTEVALQSAANAGALKIVLPVGSATINQYAGVFTASGDIQWGSLTATQSPSGTVQLSASLTSSATVSNPVFLFTSKIEKPVDIITAYLRDQNGDDTTMAEYERHRWADLYDKDRSGEPSGWMFEPSLLTGKLYLNYKPDDALEKVRLVYRRVFEDFDSMNDNPDVPPEVIRALEWNLASEIGPEYGIPADRQQMIDAKAAMTLLQIQGIYNDSPRTSEPTCI